MRLLPSSRSALLLSLLVLCGLGGYAYWEHQLRLAAADALAVSDRDRADLRKRLWALQQRSASTPPDRPVPPPGGDPAGFGGPLDDPRALRPGGRFDNFAQLLDNPEAQRLAAIQQRAALDSRYGALFRQMHLTPEQLDKFKSLLVEKQTAVVDVLAAARAQGITGQNNRAELTSMIQSTQAEVDATIQSTLGAAAYAQYQGYEQTLPQRNTVTALDTRLSYSAAPLTSEQSDQLIQILSANPAPSASGRTGGGGAGVFGALARGGSTAPISDAAVAQAQTVLTTDQVQALQQLQQEQQAQAQLMQLMRSQGQQRRSPPAGGSTSAAATTPPPGG